MTRRGTVESDGGFSIDSALDIVESVGSSVPDPLTKLGIAIGKPFIKDWWTRTRKLQTVAGKIEGVLAARQQQIAQRDIQHRFEQIGHQIERLAAGSGGMWPRPGAVPGDSLGNGLGARADEAVRMTALPAGVTTRPFPSTSLGCDRYPQTMG
jgi:hypothetical protein